MEQAPPHKERGVILGWIVAHPKTTLALSLLLALVLVGWLLDSAAEKRLERRLDAIRATGAPVTVDDLNAAMPDIPDDENMALLLLEHAEPILAFKSVGGAERAAAMGGPGQDRAHRPAPAAGAK